MRKYRIKTVEKYSGEFTYFPQVTKQDYMFWMMFKLSFGLILIFILPWKKLCEIYSRWEPISFERNTYENYFVSSCPVECSNIENAKEIIKIHHRKEEKKLCDIANSEFEKKKSQIKRIRYIKIDNTSSIMS